MGQKFANSPNSICQTQFPQLTECVLRYPYFLYFFFW